MRNNLLRLAGAGLVACALAGAADAAVVLTDGGTYTQNFNTLAATGTSSTLPTGWLSVETGANANATYTAGTGSSNTGDTYSFGASGSTDRALGGLRSGNLVPLFGAVFTNATGASLTALDIAFTGEQWRLGALNRVDQLDFQYQIGATGLTAGSWTAVGALTFTAPVTTGTVGALNGNLAANRATLAATLSGLDIAAGQSFAIRFVDLDAAGADDGLAIDDFSLTPTLFATAPIPEPATWAMLIGGFGLVGASSRRRRTRAVLA